MTGERRLILVNLSRLESGCSTVHLSRFLPELVAIRPDDAFVAVVPNQHTKLVRGWGLTACPSQVSQGAPVAPVPRRRLAKELGWRHPAVILGPLGQIPMLSRAPQIVWASETPDDTASGEVKHHIRQAMARVISLSTNLSVYPSASARRIAESHGARGQGIILRPPVREERPAVPTRSGVHVPGRPLRILVPAADHSGNNLTLLPRLSSALRRRGIDHHIWVAGNLPSHLQSSHLSGDFAYDRDKLSDLREQFDVVLVPTVRELCCASLVEFERMGFSVAASDIDAHAEARDRARLFDPASPDGAADAVLAPVDETSGHRIADDQSNWRFNTPHEYAAAVSVEMDRLISGSETPWAV